MVDAISPGRSNDGRSNLVADWAAVQLRALAHRCALEAFRTHYVETTQHHTALIVPDERVLASWALELRLCLARFRLCSWVHCFSQ